MLRVGTPISKYVPHSTTVWWWRRSETEKNSTMLFFMFITFAFDDAMSKIFSFRFICVDLEWKKKWKKYTKWKTFKFMIKTEVGNWCSEYFLLSFASQNTITMENILQNDDRTRKKNYFIFSSCFCHGLWTYIGVSHTERVHKHILSAITTSLFFVVVLFWAVVACAVDNEL